MTAIYNCSTNDYVGFYTFSVDCDGIAYDVEVLMVNNKFDRVDIFSNGVKIECDIIREKIEDYLDANWNTLVK